MSTLCPWSKLKSVLKSIMKSRLKINAYMKIASMITPMIQQTEKTTGKHACKEKVKLNGQPDFYIKPIVSEHYPTPEQAMS